jgi:hypothetical protein
LLSSLGLWRAFEKGHASAEGAFSDIRNIDHSITRRTAPAPAARRADHLIGLGWDRNVAAPRMQKS